MKIDEKPSLLDEHYEIECIQSSPWIEDGVEIIRAMSDSDVVDWFIENKRNCENGKWDFL